MVLSNFLSRRITPLQACTSLAWQYTREGDTMRLKRSHGSDLTPDVLRALLGKLSPDPYSSNFITPPPACAPLCSNQATRTRWLRELPTLDEIGITAW
jgi:hypothetical protein